MFPFVFLCLVLLSPCVLGSVENCTATKCLRCLSNVVPNCTVSQIDPWLYNVYCEPPITSNCMDINVTKAYCFTLVDIVNANGQWKYQALKFSFQNYHSCSNINGNPVLPNCLHLYSEVTSVEDVGHNIFCRCYEDDCQKRINVTFRVTGIITSTPDGTPSMISTFTSISVEQSIMPTTSTVQDDDMTSSLTAIFSLGNVTSLSQSLQTSLSTVFLSMSIRSLNTLSSTPGFLSTTTYVPISGLSSTTSYDPTSGPLSTVPYVPTSGPLSTTSYIPTSGTLSTTSYVLTSGSLSTISYVPTSETLSTISYVPTSGAMSTTSYVPTLGPLSTVPYISTSGPLSNIPYVPTSGPLLTISHVPSFSPTSPQPSNSVSLAAYLIIIIAVVIVILLLSISTMIIIIVCLKRKKTIHTSNEVEMTHRRENIYSITINDLRPITAIAKKYTGQGDNKEEITDVPTHPHIHGSFLKQLSKCKIISGSSLQLQETIGQGEYGTVYRGILTPDGNIIKSAPVPVAIKTLKGLYTKEDVNSLIEESLKMSSFDHPNVLPLIGICLDHDQAPYVVMPFMARGSLLSYLKKERPNLTIAETSDDDIVLSARKQLLSMCLQVAKGMSYLAQKKFVHRDLAARNCMIDDNGIIKVGDFGLSKDVYMHNYYRQWGKNESDKKSPIKFPVKWMALESLHDGLFSEKTDVWSYGVLCWEVFSLGKIPYPGLDPLSVVQLLDSGGRLLIPNNAACSEEIYKLMMFCWESNPEERPTFSDLVQSIEEIMKPLADYIDINALNS